MRVLAIDPGNIESGVVLWDGEKIIQHGKYANDEVLQIIYHESYDTLLIEMIASYGMAVGKEVFETCVWIGRFQQARIENLPVSHDIRLVYRREVKLHHCQSAKAKDSNIRQALIDKYGDKGTKKAPGTTYGLSADTWQAFALATYFTEAA